MDNTKIIVGNRFDSLLKALNHSIPSFAKTLGYERCDKLYNIQKGKYYPSFEILQDITKYFVEVNIDWIISGRGSMLLDSKNPEEAKLGSTPTATPISPAEESIIYKMYKDEKEEKERLVKEKEVKIDQLQSELRTMEKELAVFKAKHEHNYEHPPLTDVFTGDSSKVYGKDLAPMTKPTPSKRSSVGKT